VPSCEDSHTTTPTSPNRRVAMRAKSKSVSVIRSRKAFSQASFPIGSATHPAVVIRKSSRKWLAASWRSPVRSASQNERSAFSSPSTVGAPTGRSGVPPDGDLAVDPRQRQRLCLGLDRLTLGFRERAPELETQVGLCSPPRPDDLSADENGARPHTGGPQL